MGKLLFRQARDMKHRRQDLRHAGSLQWGQSQPPFWCIRLCHSFLSASSKGSISHNPQDGSHPCIALFVALSPCATSLLFWFHISPTPMGDNTSVTCIEAPTSLLDLQIKKLCERGKCQKGKNLPIFLAGSDLPEVFCCTHTTFLRKGT